MLWMSKHKCVTSYAYFVINDFSEVELSDMLQSAVVAISAIVNALYEANMVAIVRRVYAANGAVRLGCLFPNIKKDYEVKGNYNSY